MTTNGRTWLGFALCTTLACNGIEAPDDQGETAQAARVGPAADLDRAAGDHQLALAAPTIGAERAVDAGVPGFSGGRAREPAIAWSGTGSFVVWRDDRSGWPSDIYGARVQADGTLVDVRGIVVAGDRAFIEFDPAVTWTGHQWLVAWSVDDGDGGDIRAATVSTTGEVTQLGVVAQTNQPEIRPALAGDEAGGAMLVWQQNSTIRAAAFSGGGFGAAFSVAATMVREGNPAVAHSTGGNYLVAWEAEGGGLAGIRGRRVTPAGVDGMSFDINPGDPDNLAQTVPALAFNGTNYVVAWRLAGDIHAARVSTDGAVLDQTSVVVSATPDQQGAPSVACDAGSCLVAWEDRRDVTDPTITTFGVYGQRLGAGLVLEGGEITISDPLRRQGDVALARRRNGFTAVWDDQRTGVAAIMLTPIGADGAVEAPDGILVNRGRINSQNRPSYARTSTSQLAVWSDSRSFGDDIMARRYSGTGARLDTGALVVSDAQYDQSEPSVDWDGSQYLVAWHDARNPSYDIFAARFAEDGTLLDPTGIAIATADRNQLFPDVASGDGVSLVAWHDRRVLENGDDILAAIVTADGAVAVGDIAVCTTGGDQQRPAVAWDASSGLFVVAWADRRAVDETADVYAARVEPDGDVLDPCGVLVSGAASDQWMVDLAASGDQLLLVWEDYRIGSLEPDVYGARLRAASILSVLDSDGIAIAGGVSGQGSPAVGSLSEGRWGVAWTDDRNFAVTGTDIRGNTVQPSGALEEPYDISAEPEFETGPSFENGVSGTNTLYLLYQRSRIEGTGLVRVRRRLITY